MGKAIEDTISIAAGLFLLPSALLISGFSDALLWPALNWTIVLPLVSLLVFVGISASVTAARRMCRLFVLFLLSVLVASFAILFYAGVN